MFEIRAQKAAEGPGFCCGDADGEHARSASWRLSIMRLGVCCYRNSRSRRASVRLRHLASRQVKDHAPLRRCCARIKEAIWAVRAESFFDALLTAVLLVLGAVRGGVWR
jgi:hypothetical protein